MTDAILTSSTANTRAAAYVLAHAVDQVGLPDPIGVSTGRGYDNEHSRNGVQVRFQFKDAEDLQAWATHLGVEVVSQSTIASSHVRRVASVWHHDAVTEWLGVTFAMTAVTERPARTLAVVP